MDLRTFIVPAIDIKDGKVVRLYKGDYSKVKVYAKDPVELARYFDGLGFKKIHIVDLDGAKDGIPVNAKVLERIRNSVGCEIEFGGGIRDKKTADYLLNTLGVNYIVVGTLAVKNPPLFKELVNAYPQRVILSVDTKGGKVAVGGWLESSGKTPEEFAKEFDGLPLWGYLYTVVERDGTLQGVDVEPYRRFKKISNKPLLASGGVASEEDIKKLVGITDGVVVGKAFYEGRINFEELLRS